MPRENYSNGKPLRKGELERRLARLNQLGVLQGTSRRVLAAIQDDTYWLEVIGKLEKSEDWRTIAEVLKYHQTMRDGRPVQQINVTSFGVTVSADEIESARAIVRELRGSQVESGQVIENKPLMLSGDEGTIRGGVRDVVGVDSAQK